MDKIYDTLIEMDKGGAEHKDLIEFLRNTNHQGYEISEDQSMIATIFEDGIIIISPYNNIKKIKKEK